MTPDDQHTLPYVPPPPEFPRAFGRYELLDSIGVGGMGCVYRARPAAGGPAVALKTPLPHLLTNPHVRERFYREYQALALFRHPGLAPVLDFGQHADAYYFTMAFIDGVPLSAARPDGPAAVARLAVAVADAVGHAHDRGIVHRDLKPANVIVRPDGRPVVVDFGIALALDADPDGRLTSGGTLLGTRPYMPPEQINGDIHAMGPRSDVYSLGVILYWMLTGRLPFPGTGAELIRQVRDVRPVPPADLVQTLDPRLSAAVVRALEKHPADRFPTMAALAAALAVDAVADVVPAATATTVRYEFVGADTTAPADVRGRLYLDVGNDLRPGVLDHHHGGAEVGSATRLVAEYPELVRASADPAGGPVTVVLHAHPDLDCVAASYLAAALLTKGELPAGAVALAEYLDRVDSGEPMFTLRKPYTLYAAHMTLARRLATEVLDPPARWDALVCGGHRLVAHVLDAVGEKPLGAVNAFESKVMTQADRLEVTEDAQRYERKLADPNTHARRAMLHLPTPWGERVTVEALLVRDVQTDGDPERCTFFKDWARTDAERSPAAGGFPVLCVWTSRPKSRCIISVRPDADARLTGLGALLDAAETAARAGTGRERAGPPRPGYDNPDPWYDGRAHHDTIIDAPRDGTALSADAVEQLLLDFGRGTTVPLEPSL